MSYAMNDKTIVKASAGIFHNRVTLNDSMLLGGNPPFQPQVGVTNGSADNPGGAGGAGSLPFSMTAIDPVFKLPTAYMWSVGVQREIPMGFVLDVAYVGRRGLYLQRERDINQLLPGTVQANPGINSARSAAVRGLRRRSACPRTPATRSTTACRSARSAVTRTASSSARPTRSATRSTTRSNKRDVLFNAYDDSGYWGNSNFDRRHVFNFYYIYDLPFYRDQQGAWARSSAGGRSRARRSCARARRCG